MASRVFPRTPEQFLEELERRAPEPRPGPEQSIEQIMFEAGRRSIAREMRDLYHLTRKRDLDDIVPL